MRTRQNGLGSRELSSDNPPTEIGKYFEREWVTEIYYGGEWYQVKPGTYQSFSTQDGLVYSYEDPVDAESVVVSEEVKGYKFRKPESPGTVTQLHKK